MRYPKRFWLLAGAIVALTFVVYLPSLGNGFVRLDDDGYVLENPLIRSISPSLFTSYCMGNYHPLVMLVYAVVHAMAGLEPAAYHVVSLVLHLICTVLVSMVLLELTGKAGVAALAGLLFGLQPVHVESVAWVSALKDPMYALFFLLSMFFHVRYIKSGYRKVHLMYCLIAFVCALLSKGMAVTLPLVLLLIDRFMDRRIDAKALLEKVPFLALSLLFGIIAIQAQASAEALMEAGRYSFPQRIVFASYAFITYLWKMIVPYGLSAFYPYPVAPGGAMGGLLVYPLALLALAALVVYGSRRSKVIWFGMGFFTVTVLLVLQLFPYGEAVMADRYSYLSSIGIYMIIAYGVDALYQRLAWRRVVQVTSVLALAACGYLTLEQGKVWHDSMTLFNAVLEKHEVPIIYNNRGNAFADRGEQEKAVKDFSRALAIAPTLKQAYSNRGLALTTLGRHEEALNDLDAAVRLDGDYAEAIYNRGNVHFARKDYPKAFADYDRTVELEPANAKAWCNRANIYTMAGQHQRAIEEYSTAVRLDPGLVTAYGNRGGAYLELKRIPEACADFQRALALGDERARSMVAQLCN